MGEEEEEISENMKSGAECSRREEGNKEGGRQVEISSSSTSA